MESDIASSDFIVDGFEGISDRFTDITLIRETTYNVLYRAKREGQWWALKGLPVAEIDNPIYQEILRKEFELLERVQSPGHPSILKLAGLEKLSEPPICGTFLVMEWVEGQTLRKFLQGNPSLSRRRKVAAELMDALDYLHHEGVVHRDLKPENIMVTRNGDFVKLIDFGLADTDNYAVLKGAGGTRGYIAPEQAQGSGPDIRNDIYSLGIIFQEMLPEEKDTHVSERCTQSIDRRFHDIHEVREAWEKEHRKRRLRNTIIKAIIAISILGILGGLLWHWWTNRIASQILEDMTAWTYTEPQCFNVKNKDKHNTITFRGDRNLIEVAHCPLYVQKGERYRVSVNYSGEGFDTIKVGDAGFQFFVRESIPQRIWNNSGVASSECIPLKVTQNKRLTVDFTATSNTMYLRLNFGWVANGKTYIFQFDNFKLEKLDDIPGNPIPINGSIQLLHEATNLYLQGGHLYNCQASLGNEGLGLDLTKCGRGYLIDTHEYDPGDGIEERFLNYYHNIDLGTPWINVNAQVWYFIKQSDGCYAMTPDGKLFLTYTSPDQPLQMLPLRHEITEPTLENPSKGELKIK